MRSMKWGILVMIGILLLTSSTVYAGTGDDNDSNYPEVGGEWVENYPWPNGLNQCSESVEGLYNKLGNYGWTKSFIWGNSLAWEEDFKAHTIGGTDNIYVDNVDLAVFSGHGARAGGLVFSDLTHDDSQLIPGEASWGDKDMEWMLLDNCLQLSDANIGRWQDDMQTLHLICGAKTPIYDYDNLTHVADNLIDNGWWDVPVDIRVSWFLGMDYDQPPTIWDDINGNGVVDDGEIVPVTLRVLGETADNGNDYIWQQGYVSSDPVHDQNYSFWAYTCN